MRLRLCLTFYCSILYFAVFSQVGGENTYQFLELNHSARVVALGGNQVALNDTTDLSLPFFNPSLLTAYMSNHALFSYVNYFSDINFGYASYARSFGKIGNFALGMHYINYGNFREATEVGELTGNSFKAAEYALNIIYSRTWKNLNLGFTLKPVLSVFENYQSAGMAADVGINYDFGKKLTRIAIVARNFGTQFTTYYSEGEKESLPFNLLAGISHKLKYAPFAMSVTAQHLTNWDLANPEPKEGAADDFNIFERDESFSKQVMRHLIFGLELLPSKNFTIRTGYNYQRRQELKLEEKASTVGMSLGFGIKLNRFRFDFATSRFHVAGSSNVFSLIVNLNQTIQNP